MKSSSSILKLKEKKEKHLLSSEMTDPANKDVTLVDLE